MNKQSCKQSRSYWMLLGLAAVMVIGMQIKSGANAEGNAAPGSRVYELRTYHCNEGKLDNLHERFSQHTNPLFVKHGITLIGYWTPTDEGSENTLIYLIAHDSREAAKKNWSAFIADPDWKKAYAESIADGKIVDKIESVYMNPTDYSPLR